MCKRMVWECTDCALGEMGACRFEGWLEYNDEESKPVSCPIGRWGKDAVWRVVEELPSDNSTKLPLLEQAFRDGYRCGRTVVPVDLAWGEWQLRASA